MAFIGHDIVSLKLQENIQSFSKPAYIAKILHADESPGYYTSISKTALIWSIKESAYKVMLKNGLSVSFSPAMYKIKFYEETETFCSGIIQYENTINFFHSFIYTDYCSTVCTINPEDLNKYKLIVKKYSGINYHSLILDDISKEFTLDKNKLTIAKNENGIPHVSFNNEILDIDLSISHDGEIHSYAWIKK